MLGVRVGGDPGAIVVLACETTTAATAGVCCCVEVKTGAGAVDG